MMNASQQSPEDDTGSSGLVLIVDDDERQARNIKDYLILQGIAAETAPNGFAAINAVKQLQPAIVLLDIRMPGIDGIEVTRHVLRLDTSPTVILMSGYPESIHDANVAQLGVFAVVQKPLPLKIVAAFVRRAFAARPDETSEED
jgi:two-component system, response regulator, stage 0 sporulation protein F